MDCAGAPEPIVLAEISPCVVVVTLSVVLPPCVMVVVDVRIVVVEVRVVVIVLCSAFAKHDENESSRSACAAKVKRNIVMMCLCRDWRGMRRRCCDQRLCCFCEEKSE